MKRFLYLVSMFLLFAFVACGPSAVEIEEIEKAAVGEYQAAQRALPTGTPLPTYTPYPTLVPLPTPTPRPTLTPWPTLVPLPTYTPYPTPEPLTVDVSNLYCNYGFCIRFIEDTVGLPGYAVDVLSEVIDDLNETDDGLYWWINVDDSRMIFAWDAVSRTPLDFVTDYIDNPDYSNADEVMELDIGQMLVTYITYEKIGDDLPYRMISAWRCGGRLFKLGISLAEDEQVVNQLEESVTDFVCSEA